MRTPELKESKEAIEGNFWSLCTLLAAKCHGQRPFHGACQADGWSDTDGNLGAVWFRVLGFSLDFRSDALGVWAVHILRCGFGLNDADPRHTRALSFESRATRIHLVNCKLC